MRELDFSEERWKAEQIKRKGIITKFQNIIIPVVLPQVESAVTFQSEMFLSGFPIFGSTADPKHVEAATMMDTIIGNQQIRGGWVLEYQKSFRDGFKYNILGTLVDWKRERVYSVSQGMTTDAKLTELIWEGNEVKRLDMYNTYWDTSVSPGQVSINGEFAGFKELFTKIRLQRWLLSTMGSTNSDQALGSNSISTASAGIPPENYYFPRLNPEALVQPDTIGNLNWIAFWNGQMPRGEAVQALYSALYQVTTHYCRIVPKEFGINKVPAPEVPQLWKFVMINNKVLVLAERLTNAHDQLPIIFAQPLDDGLGYQTKSLSDNVLPVQEVTTALANSSIQSRRRAISDRALYDPLRINARDINNDSPTAKIPAKPSAFGSQLSEAYYPIPFRDDQFQINSAEMTSYLSLADMITGLNRARMGQFTKGNRTKSEFQDIMAYGSGRDKATSQSLECSLFTPTKEILKANILQYQTGEDMFSPATSQPVSIDPLILRRAMLAFKLSDGLLPSEKILGNDALTVAMQTLQSVPQLAAGYNVVPMFSYLLKTQGAKLSEFEKSPQQLAYEQAMQSWQNAIMQAGQQIAKVLQSSQGQEIDPKIIEQIQKGVPPQPKPADYGYDPAHPQSQADQRSGTVIGQYQAELGNSGNNGQQMQGQSQVGQSGQIGLAGQTTQG